MDDQRVAQLQEYYRQYGVIPSFRTIGGLVGIASTNGVSRFVKRLLDRGLIRKAPDSRLRPTKSFFARRWVGNAPAGFPSPADELKGDVITIDDYLVEHPSSTVLVQVSGDSMINAGIHDGDFLVVERNTTPAVGKIVVAMVDNSFTVKYLRQNADDHYLEAANPDYPDIIPETGLEIYGEVVGQFRKMA